MTIRQSGSNVLKYIKFLSDYLRFKASVSKGEKRFPLTWKDRYPCLHDRTQSTEFDAHYLYHPAWAARILAQEKPELHIDISSSILFCSVVSAFVPIKFYDYRPANIALSDLSCDAADLLALPFPDGSIGSLSCMHVVEHVGLGRYGDPLDPEGDIKAIAELTRVLASGASLLFVVPIGKARIQFNAHRIYSYSQIISYFKGLQLKEFSLVMDGNGGFIRNATKEMADQQLYGCGCFWFTK